MKEIQLCPVCKTEQAIPFIKVCEVCHEMTCGFCKEKEMMRLKLLGLTAGPRNHPDFYKKVK